MLKEGVYEQLINKKLKGKLNELNLDKYLIEKEDLNVEEGEVLTALYSKINNIRAVKENKAVRP